MRNSHTDKVRALCFLPEIPYALLSGSWDSTIKMWDIRSGNCMLTINDHCSDVYGLSFHPERPFVFSSCSRDTSIRTFCIEGMISSLKLNFLCSDISTSHQIKGKLIDEPSNTFAKKGTYQLSSQIAHKLV